jgi:hypothetical protein
VAGFPPLRNISTVLGALKFGATVDLFFQNKIMIRINLPESITVVNGFTAKNIDSQRAEQILNALIASTSQVDYDEVTVDQLIHEYERLMS